MLKHVIKAMPPPVFWLLAKRICRGNREAFTGNYTSWQEAVNATEGYDAPTILERVRKATLKVKHGEAVFERDSVCFDYEEYRWPTLGCLLRVAAENGGKLRVLDFGGSLGSFYFQHRKHFRDLKEVRWSVVEQAHFVDCGREEFQDDVLKFYESIDDCMEVGTVDVVFCSSVLEYLEKPYEILESMVRSGIPYILLDRTPFIEGTCDRLTVQHVPATIYPASYPAWFFSEVRFFETVKQLGLHVDVGFPAQDDVGIGEFKGVLLGRA